MSRYKYTTPYWTDQFERIYDSNDNQYYFESYAITELQLLNDNATETSLIIYFYDGAGNEYEAIRVNSVMPAKTASYLRIGDIIEAANPNYLSVANRRSGWLKITSSDRLAVTGKITSGSKREKTTVSEMCNSILFFESELEPLGRIAEPIDVGNEPLDNKNPFGRRVPRPFPR